MAHFRDVEFGVRKVRPDGILELPGGVCARIGSGSPGTVLTFPVVGFFDDGVQAPLAFMDTGPTPLLTQKVTDDGVPPKVVLTGLTPGLVIAFQVAKSREAARYMNSGGQLATDSAGRLVIVGADPTKASFFFAVSMFITNANIFALNNAGSKTVRIHRVIQRWPGKQTAAALALFHFSRDTGLATAGTDLTGSIFPLDETDASGCTLKRAPTALSGEVQMDGGSHRLWVPAADGAFAPYTLIDEDDAALRRKPLIIKPGEAFSASWDISPGAGWDNGGTLLVNYTEE